MHSEFQTRLRSSLSGSKTVYVCACGFAHIVSVVHCAYYCICCMCVQAFLKNNGTIFPYLNANTHRKAVRKTQSARTNSADIAGDLAASPETGSLLVSLFFFSLPHHSFFTSATSLFFLVLFPLSAFMFCFSYYSLPSPPMQTWYCKRVVYELVLSETRAMTGVSVSALGGPKAKMSTSISWRMRVFQFFFFEKTPSPLCLENHERRRITHRVFKKKKRKKTKDPLDP